MAKNRCPDCGRGISNKSRCHRCGWRGNGGEGEASSARPAARWARVAVVVVIALALGVAGVYRLQGASFADWYAEFALRNLPAQFSSFAPAETPSGAFYHCVSRVVKKVSDGTSVETFPPFTEDNTVALGDGRYSVKATVDAVNDAGQTVKRSFTCVARFDAGHWVTESLTVE